MSGPQEGEEKSLTLVGGRQQGGCGLGGSRGIPERRFPQGASAGPCVHGSGAPGQNHQGHPAVDARPGQRHGPHPLLHAGECLPDPSLSPSLNMACKGSGEGRVPREAKDLDPNPWQYLFISICTSCQAPRPLGEMSVASGLSDRYSLCLGSRSLVHLCPSISRTWGLPCTHSSSASPRMAGWTFTRTSSEYSSLGLS